MSDIPKAREELLKLAQYLSPGQAAKVHSIVKLLRRKAPVRRVPDKSNPLSAAAKQYIKAKASSNMSVAEIAHDLGVNPGRVSEVLNGKK